MKRVVFLFLALLNLTHLFGEESKATPSLEVQQDIVYLSKEASEVYIVWGINNWNIPEEALRPEGSYIKDNLIYTPMHKKGHSFTVSFKVKQNTMIDYVFWITAGPAAKPVDMWDVNVLPQKDYHTFSSNTNTVLVNSKVSARPKEALSILDFVIPLLSITTTLLLLILIIKFYVTGSSSLQANNITVIGSTAVVTSLFLALARSSVTGQSWDLYLHPFNFFPKIIWSAYYDVLFVCVLSFIFIILSRLLKNYLRIQKIIKVVFPVFCLLIIIAGILNIRVVETIGKPFNYPWLYYSDFLKSSDAHAAVSSNISGQYIAQIIMVSLSAIFCMLTFVALAETLIARFKMRKTLNGAFALSAIFYVTIAPGAVKHYNWDYNKLANPVVAFAGSFGPFSGDPELFTMNVEDSLKFNLFIKKNAKIKSNPAIKNVILFVMESTPAEYIQPYSTVYKITPELEKHLNESIVFDNMYAHAPATNNSMVSILGSVYPWLSYNSITKEHPDVKIPTISSELKKHGFRTAFFNSADNRFQKAGEFLSNRSFDDIKDCSTVNCEKGFAVKDDKWDFLDGKDDECTGDDLFAWVNQEKEKPFFAMMWTYQTHYPYFASGEEVSYNTADPVFNRYLNAVHHSDAVLGKLLDDLKANGLSESTLVVVVGDHGEAFGRHQQTTHASGIYEENLHVPFFLINPSFKAEHKDGIAGLVDIAPTVLDLLGYDPSEKWQGKDLFTATKNDRVYFFTPWADYLFGYREGDYKYIFNATKNISEMYDLKNDPQETTNIASQFPDKTDISHQRIAGWVQSSNKYMNTLLASGK